MKRLRSVVVRRAVAAIGLVALAAACATAGGRAEESPPLRPAHLADDGGTSIVVPYAARWAAVPGRDLVLRRAAYRTMAMTGRINEWDWEGGIAMVGLMHAYEATGDEVILDYVADWVDARLAEGTAITDPRWSDPQCGTDDWPGPGLRHPNHAAPAWAVLMLHAHRPDPWYLAEVEATVDYLASRACRAGGTLAHLPDQLWDDTLAMSVPVMARYGALHDRPDLLDQAVGEVLAHAEHLQASGTGLWYHGWSFRTGDHMSGAHWGRGNGWAAVAVTELLRWLPEDHPRRAEVIGVLDRQLRGLAAVQDGSGLWHTVVVRPDFYLETSGSAAAAAAMLRAHSAGWVVDPQVQLSGHRGRAAVYRKVAPDGTVTDVSTGTGVAESIDVYNQVPHDEIKPYGQGLFLIMATAPGVRRAITPGRRSGTTSGAG